MDLKTSKEQLQTALTQVKAQNITINNLKAELKQKTSLQQNTENLSLQLNQMTGLYYETNNVLKLESNKNSQLSIKLQNLQHKLNNNLKQSQTVNNNEQQITSLLNQLQNSQQTLQEQKIYFESEIKTLQQTHKQELQNIQGLNYQQNIKLSNQIQMLVSENEAIAKDVNKSLINSLYMSMSK
ncbi:Hypothetical_protein [Hexamita inflata]|uniref:Hypothetical_protein n=1 Tax=Hexamita inflata TaxID=28002 RepID=A0AA86THM2_9EUKA|nr:Hypothetical protein HINF_LOCUS5505 [Hexamita inflata]